MADEARDRELIEALGDFDQYLSDGIAPLLVIDSIELLLRFPPKLVAEGIASWATRQFRLRGGAVRLSDFLFHGVNKIQQMGELELVAKERLAKYLLQLNEIVMNNCPEAERALLRENLDRLIVGHSATTRPVELLFHQQEEESLPPSEPGSAAPASASVASEGAALTEELVRGLRRFSVLLGRLEATPKLAAAPVRETGQWELASQLFAAAAQNAQSESDLRQYLDRLRQAGMGEVRPDEVIRTLSRSLPNWIFPVEQGELPYLSGPVEAMRRIVVLADNPAEGAERFREMVKAGVEQFNAGSFARAVTILQLAERIVAEKKVDLSTANLVRGSAHESLDQEQLRKLASEPEQYPLLRKLLKFFPAFKPEGLLAALEADPDRQRRRLLLTLMEVHGADLRAPVFDRLERSFAESWTPEGWQLQRNLVYLLRRIPPPAKGPEPREIDCVIRLSLLEHPAPLVREALAYLGQIPDERAEQALVARLRELEGLLAKPAEAIYTVEELLRLLSLVAANLARFGTSRARKAVVEHGLKQQPQLGNNLERLAELRAVNLSDDPDLVKRLLEHLSSLLPVKVLGFVVHRNEDKIRHLIDALSGTPLPAVQQTLAEVVQRFSGHDFAKAAAAALERFDSGREPLKAAPASKLEGDLEVFGLPNLLQSLAHTQVTGLLTLRDRNGKPMASLSLQNGELRACRAGRLEGEQAFYELLEKPFSVTFQFSAQPAPETDPAKDEVHLQILPLLMEGMRRYDELQRASALVPDEAKLKPTGVNPTPPPGEDEAFTRDVWAKIKPGVTPRECEEAITADSYRTRALLAHWVEEGALEAV